MDLQQRKRKYRTDAALDMWHQFTHKLRETIVTDRGNEISLQDYNYYKSGELSASRSALAIAFVLLSLIGFNIECSVIAFALGTTYATGMYILSFYPSIAAALGIIVIAMALIEDTMAIYGDHYHRSVRWTLIIYLTLTSIFPVVITSTMLWTLPLTNVIVTLSLAGVTMCIPFCWIAHAFSDSIKAD